MGRINVTFPIFVDSNVQQSCFSCFRLKETNFKYLKDVKNVLLQAMNAFEKSICNFSLSPP